jgi:HEPN domain-containing protein
MSAPAELLGWIARAEEDFTLARSALRRKKPLLYGATFHAQQCVEKYIKALLVARGLAFPRTHDLVALTDLCLQGGIIIPVEQEALDLLAAYAVQVRYPGEDPALAEVREALQVAQTVRRFVRKFLNPYF